MVSRFVLASVLGVFMAAGCVEFVGDAGSQSADDAARPEHIVVHADSTEERKVHVTLVAAGDQTPYWLGNVTIQLAGTQCTGLRAGGDATWDVGEAVVLTPVTKGCGGQLVSGAVLDLVVTVRGQHAYDGTVTVR